MANLLFRSILVVALLFGLLFAVGMGVITYFDLPPTLALVFALGILLLQFILGPTILQWIYKIEWVDPNQVDPELASFLYNTCAAKGIPVPRFGLIRDGNPNAFTFGHYPGDARLVVTTGLLELLEGPEQNAVVAHELGHIAHWDFVVMTLAAAVPLLLYVLFITTRGGRRQGRSGSYAALIAFVSYIAYIISHYIVLLLSRVREYYADRFAADVTQDPEALSTALVKVAYGLAAAPKEKEKKDDARMVAGRAFGIFDPSVAQTLALAGAGSGGVSTSNMESAMKWDLWNPWATLFELRSSHPLPAKRIRALEKQAEALGKVPRHRFRAEKPESFWDEFLVDVLVNYLPIFSFILGIIAGILLFPILPIGIASIGVVVLFLCGAIWLKRRFSYRPDFSDVRDVKSLIGEVKVSAIRSIPCSLRGKIIGRGIPGLFYSEDLVMQDNSGFIVLDYRQPIRIFEFLFGWAKAESLIGRSGTAYGWFRRAPKPYIELRRLELDDGEKATSYVYPISQFFVYAGLAIGLLLVVFEFFL